MRHCLIPILVVALALGAPLPLAAQAVSRPQSVTSHVMDVESMTRYARSLPLGSTVRVRTADARRTAVLMAVEDDALVVQRRSRHPESPLRLPLASVQSLEVKGPDSNMGVAVAAGALAGIGSFLVMMMIALGVSD